MTPSLRPPAGQPRVIQALWSGRCSVCKAPIGRGEQVMYIPPPKGSSMKGRVQHLDGECAQVYTVALIYHATRKVVKVSALSVEAALEVGKREGRKGAGLARPVGYEVYQGNVLVLNEEVL